MIPHPSIHIFESCGRTYLSPPFRLQKPGFLNPFFYLAHVEGSCAGWNRAPHRPHVQVLLSRSLTQADGADLTSIRLANFAATSVLRFVSFALLQKTTNQHHAHSINLSKLKDDSVTQRDQILMRGGHISHVAFGKEKNSSIQVDKV